MRLRILTIIFVVLYWTLMLSMHASADDLGKAAKDLGKYYLKPVVESYVDLNNPYIKYPVGAVSVLTDKKVNIKLNNNTKFTIQEDGIMIKFKKEF